MSDYIEINIDKFIFRVAGDRLYSSDGVWAFCEESQGVGRVRIGLTDYLQQLNGDVAFAHLKPIGTKLAAGDEFAEIETIKATESFFSPVGGTVVEINADLDLSPEIINQEPYGKGWLVVIEAPNWPSDRAKLLDANAYQAAMRSQAEEVLKKK